MAKRSEEDKLIALLSSTDRANEKLSFKWLQRFTLGGTPYGEPLNLCAPGFLPDDVRDDAWGSFEGLGWLEEGKSLVLINDHKYSATAVAIAIDPWPDTDKSIACDEELP